MKRTFRKRGGANSKTKNKRTNSRRRTKNTRSKSLSEKITYEELEKRLLSVTELLIKTESHLHECAHEYRKIRNFCGLK